MTAVIHDFRARGNQAKVRYDKSPVILLSGPMGTGKSRTCLEKVHLVCLLRPNVRALITRKTFTSIRASVLDTFLQYVIKDWIDAGLVNVYGGTIPRQIQYRNGSTIDIVGLDNPGRINSTEFDIIYVAEAIELNLEDWVVVNGRARASALSYNQVLADTNPAHEGHWLYQLVLDGKVKFYDTYHEDNPKWFDDDGELTEAGKKYIARLDDMVGIWYQRYRLGKWVSAEGAIFDNFNAAVHVIEPFEIPASWPRYWSIDFGHTNPFVCQWWAEDHDGRLYLYREIYHTKRRVAEHADQILNLVTDGEGQWTEPKPSAIICDHDPGKQADLHHTLERYLALGTTNARKTVSDGIQAVQGRLKVADDGSPRVFFFNNALVDTDQALKEARKPTCTVEEIPGYRWNPSKDEPVKENDHGCDAMRYMVAHKDLRIPFAMVI